MQAKGVLFINPNCVDSEAVIDDLTRKMAYLLTKANGDAASKGSYFAAQQRFAPRMGTRGIHMCQCGARSTSQDYLIGVTGDGIAVVTNWLAAHYLAYHRSSVSQCDLDLIAGLSGDADPTPQLLQSPTNR